MSGKINRIIDSYSWKLYRLFNRLDIIDIVQIIIKKRECYLLDTPIYGNLGDHAISIAERQLFFKCKVNVKEICSVKLYGKEKLYAKVIPVNKYIFVHGGGFLGNLWPEGEEEFRTILSCFNQHKIVVLPQTITFDTRTPEGRRYLKESQELYSQHKDLTIFVREYKSYEFMQKYFPSIKCILVPDVVTILDVNCKQQNRNGILLCMRSDLEKTITPNDIQDVEKILNKQYPGQVIEYTDTVLPSRITAFNRKREVDKKLNQFSKSELVITDRLHGMVFAALTGTPCIALGNVNDKVKNVYQWIRQNEYIRFVDNIEEFSETLKSLDISKSYTYNKSFAEKSFQPLIELLKDITNKDKECK